MRFTIRQLQLFVATCDAGTMTGAAEQQHISQSALSTAIAELERSLGVQLLIRHHARGVVPTPIGRRLLQGAKLLLRQATELDRLAESLGNEVTGQLELGSLVTLAPLIIPSLCREFREQYPSVQIVLRETGQDQLLADLRNGNLSLALTYDLELGDDIGFEQLASLPPYALFPADHPLARNDCVSLDDLSAEPMVLLDLPISAAYFRSLFYALELTPRIQHRSPHLEVVRTLVANGFGYTLLNARSPLGHALDGRPLTAVPLHGDHRPMQLGLASFAATRESRTSAAFRDFCRSTSLFDGLNPVNPG